MDKHKIALPKLTEAVIDEVLPKKKDFQDAHGCPGNGLCLVCREVETYNQAISDCKRNLLNHSKKYSDKEGK